MMMFMITAGIFQKLSMLMFFFFSLCRYEDEINKRAAAENEFVLLKKVLKFFRTEFLFDILRQYLAKDENESMSLPIFSGC